MKKVYVAGAYSGGNILECLKNIGRGEEYSAKVFMLGYAPFCPWHDKDYVIKNWRDEFTVKMFYDYCMVWLDVSDIIFVIPGWENSKGTLAEIERAKELGIPVVYSFEELEKVANTPLNDSEALDKYLLEVATKFNRVGIRRKIIVVRKYLDAIMKKSRDEV